MKTVLITGGAGSIGRSFISKYSNDFIFHNFSRGEGSQARLKRDFPDVINHIGSIEDSETVNRVFKKVAPDIVIHAAAMKHIDIIEKEPIQACKINIIGSLNIISASLCYNVPITVAVGTDKACSSESVYGDTKYLMERCFMSANTDENKFCACRFANVAHTEGSVIPFWLSLKDKNNPLKLTDPKMNRLIFSPSDAAELINKTIVYAEQNGGGVVVTTQMKACNMLDLAKLISEDIETIGPREGEKLNEYLISEKEIPYSTKIEDLVIIGADSSPTISRVTQPYSTLTADFMSETEMNTLIYGSLL